jgi:hypothetical protein
MTSINHKVFIDATTFLGMNAEDEGLRWMSHHFFASRYHQQVTMAMEQVGLCDDVIWQYTREEQDKYYPFMDCLHTEMDIQRIIYNQQDFVRANEDPRLQSLIFSSALLMAQVLNHGGILYSHDSALNQLTSLSDHIAQFDEESDLFPVPLQVLYEQSQVLKISHENLNYV